MSIWLFMPYQVPGLRTGYFYLENKYYHKFGSLENPVYLSHMKQEIEYKGMTILEGTNGYYTAYPSKYSAFTAKDFKTLSGAKKYLDKFAK